MRQRRRDCDQQRTAGLADTLQCRLHFHYYLSYESCMNLSSAHWEPVEFDRPSDKHRASRRRAEQSESKEDLHMEPADRVVRVGGSRRRSADSAVSGGHGRKRSLELPLSARDAHGSKRQSAKAVIPLPSQVQPDSMRPDAITAPNYDETPLFEDGEDHDPNPFKTFPRSSLVQRVGTPPLPHGKRLSWSDEHGYRLQHVC